MITHRVSFSIWGHQKSLFPMFNLSHGLWRPQLCKCRSGTLSLASLDGPHHDPNIMWITNVQGAVPKPAIYHFGAVRNKNYNPHPKLIDQNVRLGEKKETRIFKYAKVWGASGVARAFSAFHSSFKKKFTLCKARVWKLDIRRWARQTGPYSYRTEQILAVKKNIHSFN